MDNRDTSKLFKALHQGVTKMFPWEIFRDSESVLFYVQLLSNLLPLARSECLLDVLRHIGEDEPVHDDVDASLLLGLYPGQLGHVGAPDVW